MTSKNPYFSEDRKAMRIADRHGLTAEYKTARRQRLTPREALEDWDLTDTTTEGYNDHRLNR